MKRWIAFILLVCLCLGLCACQTKEELKETMRLEIMKAALEEFSGQATYVRVNIKTFEKVEKSVWGATGYIYFSTSQTTTHVATFDATMTVEKDGNTTTVTFLDDYDI